RCPRLRLRRTCSAPLRYAGDQPPKRTAASEVQQQSAGGVGISMKKRKRGTLTRRAFARGLAGGGLAWAAGERLAAAAADLRTPHAVPASASGDWPTYRHDAGLTAL